MVANHGWLAARATLPHTVEITSMRGRPSRRQKMTWLSGVALVLALASGSPAAWAFDMNGYKTRLDAAITEVGAKSLSDSKATLSQLDEMVTLGVVGAKEYGAKQPRFAKLMDAVVADAPAMKNYTDAQIEDKWGENGSGGDALGVPLKSLGQFDATRAAMELIIGPSHAYIFVKKWESAQRARWLEQARDELSELREHLKEVH
jgi:hypothetical protein